VTDFGYLLASTTACSLPRPWSEALAAVCADLYTWIHPKRARAIDGRLRRIWSETGRPGAPPSPRETYRAFARAVLDFLAARPGRLRVRLDDEARAILDQVRASGRPTVIVSGHFGPWEVALQWMAREVGPLHALAQPHRSRAIERFFAARRAAFGVRTLSGGRPVSAALRRLRAGEWIAALADRGSRARIANRRACDASCVLVPLDPTPLLLARRASAQILAGVAWRAPDGAVEVRFHPPFTLEKDGIREAEATLQRFFDAHVRAHPTQWFHWGGTAG